MIDRLSQHQFMANPIELGFIFSGQDLRDFEEYLKTPTCTEEGLQLPKEAEDPETA